jgi:ABC-type Fe3+-hydroxamate transport system substrate-binding protein
VTLTSTDAAGSTAVATSLALSAATASVATVVTATDAAGQATLLTSFVPGIVLTDAAGQVTTTPAPTQSIVTTTNAQGHTVVATITPGGGVVDSLVLETTTLANGQLSTYTSYVSPQGTGASVPHLQSASAPPALRGVVTLSGVLLVAVAFGALML